MNRQNWIDDGDSGSDGDGDDDDNDGDDGDDARLYTALLSALDG